MWGVELLPLLASVQPLVVPKCTHIHVIDIMYRHISLDIGGLDTEMKI